MIARDWSVSIDVYSPCPIQRCQVSSCRPDWQDPSCLALQSSYIEAVFWWLGLDAEFQSEESRFVSFLTVRRECGACSLWRLLLDFLLVRGAMLSSPPAFSQVAH